MDSITPLLAALWAWLILIVFWTIAGFFTRRTQSSESIWGRLQHLIPLVAAYFLIFNRHRYFLLYGEMYDTAWSNWIVYPGLALVALGMGFTIWARVHLGRYWSGYVTLKEGHKVITTGPYRWVRHPLYTGWLAAMLGSAILAGTVDAIVGFELIALAFMLKLHREERLLTAELGDEYRQYMKRVPAALIPIISSTASDVHPTIHSEAFNRAALGSDRYRSIGLLCLCGAFCLLDIVSAIFVPADVHRYAVGLAWWGSLAVYEGILLAITSHAQWTGQLVRPWVWAVNTAVECFLPTIVILALTGDKQFLGPYRALVGSSVLVYCLFIILSTLRLSPMLCIISGLASSLGYLSIYLFTLHVAPHSTYRHFMPDRIYLNMTLLLFGCGLVAAAVAWQIRRHVIAALTEAETRRKLDRIEYDLKVARTIQMGLLPKSPPTVPGYDIAGFSEPADQTGGDYYDWIELPGGRVIFTIADATGHGIGPALLVAACRAYFRAIASQDEPLEHITAQVDSLIAADVSDGRFITAAIALLDPQRNHLSLYSAGQAPIYLYVAARDCVTMFDADQPPLGVHFGAGESRAREINLAPGDALVLVTDGFFEFANPTGEQFGVQRLGETIRRHQSLPARQVIQRLQDDLSGFSQGVIQADDLTAVVVKRCSP